jgi:hypothetical protein
MNAMAPRTPREERQGGVELCVRMLGLLHQGAAVCGWDHFCAPGVGECGFSPGFCGEVFLFFVGGGLRESGPEVVPDAHRAGGSGVESLGGPPRGFVAEGRARGARLECEGGRGPAPPMRSSTVIRWEV